MLIKSNIWECGSNSILITKVSFSLFGPFLFYKFLRLPSSKSSLSVDSSGSFYLASDAASFSFLFLSKSSPFLMASSAFHPIDLDYIHHQAGMKRHSPGLKVTSWTTVSFKSGNLLKLSSIFSWNRFTGDLFGVSSSLTPEYMFYLKWGETNLNLSTPLVTQ